MHLLANGYTTDTFVTNPDLTFGLQRGFQSFEHREPEGSDVANFTAAPLAAADPGRPLFLMLHLMDSHDSLLTPDEDARALSDAGVLPEIWSRTFSMLPATEQGREERLLAYDASIHYVDRQVGRTLDSLEQTARLEHAIVVVTSDHGEELFEHAASEVTLALGSLSTAPRPWPQPVSF